MYPPLAVHWKDREEKQLLTESCHNFDSLYYLEAILLSTFRVHPVFKFMLRNQTLPVARSNCLLYLVMQVSAILLILLFLHCNILLRTIFVVIDIFIWQTWNVVLSGIVTVRECGRCAALRGVLLITSYLNDVFTSVFLGSYFMPMSQVFARESGNEGDARYCLA